MDPASPNSVSVTTLSKCITGSPSSNSVWIDALQPGGATDVGGVVMGVESAESLDNGVNWLLSNSGGGSLIAAFDANTAWQSIPYTAVLYAVNPINDGFGTTTSMNKNWMFPNAQFPYYDPAPLSGVVFPAINAIDSADCHSGWAVGGRGTILATADSGITWRGASGSDDANDGQQLDLGVGPVTNASVRAGA